MKNIVSRLVVTVPFEKMDHEYELKYRGSQRIMFESESLAQQLWQRIEAAMPAYTDYFSGLKPRGIGTDGVWLPAGLNNFFRLAKNEPGTDFKRHHDV